MFRRLVRLPAGLGAGLLIASWTAVPQAIAAPVVEDPTVKVTIGSFLPTAPKPGDTVQISGTVTNTSSVTLENPQAIACLQRDRLATRAEIAAVPAEDDKPISEQNSCGRLGNAFQPYTAPLAPDETVKFSLTVPWKEWAISDQAGVYVVGVQFRGNRTDSDRVTAGRTRTLMPVVPDKSATRKVQTAMVLPLRYRPTQLAGDQFANGALAAAMAPTGKLGRQLQAGTKPKVTWLVDPAILAEAQQVAKGYKVRTPENDLITGPGSPLAKNWLTAFDAARANGDPVVLLPYGDPDVGSLVDNGLTELVRQSREETAGIRLARARSGLWLEAGSATGKSLVAGTTGYSNSAPSDLTLVSNWSWPVDERPVLTPDPVLNIATPEGPIKSTRAVVSDAALTAGGPDPATATTPVQMRQRFAAETALLATAPGTGPVKVVAVAPRNFDSDGVATQTLLQGLTLPWIQQVGLDQIATTTPRPARTPTMAPTTPGLNESHVAQIKQLNRLLDTYGLLVTDRAAAVGHLEPALLRSGSTAWRGWLQQAQRFLNFQVRTVTDPLSKVYLVSGQNGSSNPRKPIQVTLSGSKGQFPLTIANELDQSVRIGVRVQSTNRSDLRIEPLRTRTLPARQKATFQVTASAEQNGFIQARVQVVTADGDPVGPEQELVIQAAQYGNVGWILVGSAVALLFGTSLIRIYRRIRNERRNGGSTREDQPHPTPDGSARADEPAADDASAKDGVPVEDETVPEGVGRTDG